MLLSVDLLLAKIIKQLENNYWTISFRKKIKAQKQAVFSELVAASTTYSVAVSVARNPNL
jgi:hypothetical protein